MRKTLVKVIFGFLCLAVLFMGNSSGVLAYPEIEIGSHGGCLDCHFSGSIIVPVTKQFELGTPWHTSHMSEDPSCLTCHPGSPGATPIPTDNCLLCHPDATCDWQDFHTFNPTYNDNIIDFTCAQCHPQCAQPPVDTDEDGIPDSEDNCPNTPNQEQTDSYPPGGNECGDACECEGNFDGDDNQDGSDAALFKADFGRDTYNSPCSISESCNGNFDCDLDVDGTDAAKFKEDFGRDQYNSPCPSCPTEPWCVTYQ